MSVNALQDFRQANAASLVKAINEKKLLPADRVEAFMYGLEEIAESIDRLYSEIIPEIIRAAGGNETTEILQDKFWDIREEFRHIEYHIEDGRLTD